MIEKTCLFCKKTFTTSKKLKKYCCKECFSNSIKTGKIVTCNHCHKEFYRSGWALKSIKEGLFCSHDCFAKNRLGKFKPWNRGLTMSIETREKLTKHVGCKVDGCLNKHHSGGLCTHHYNLYYDKLNHSKRCLTRRLWYENNKNRSNKVRGIWANKKYNSDPGYKILVTTRNRLYRLIKKYISGRNLRVNARNIFGCSLNELISHIEKKWYPRKNGEMMSWNNWSKNGWHIDHIIEFQEINRKDLVQIGKLCHYSNLQPLWSEDNLSKKVNTMRRLSNLRG